MNDLYAVKEIDYQQEHLNKIDELNSLVRVLVDRNEYSKIEKFLNKQIESVREVKKIERERKSRMEFLSESLEREGIETEVVYRGI